MDRCWHLSALHGETFIGSQTAAHPSFSLDMVATAPLRQNQPHKSPQGPAVNYRPLIRNISLAKRMPACPPSCYKTPHLKTNHGVCLVFLNRHTHQLLPEDSNTGKGNRLPSNKSSRSLEIMPYLKGTEDYEQNLLMNSIYLGLEYIFFLEVNSYSYLQEMFISGHEFS